MLFRAHPDFDEVAFVFFFFLTFSCAANANFNWDSFNKKPLETLEATVRNFSTTACNRPI